jgi:hypothetical protein
LELGVGKIQAENLCSVTRNFHTPAKGFGELVEVRASAGYVSQLISASLDF